MENEILRKVQQNYKHWGETRDESWQGNKGRFSWVYALTLESLSNDGGDVNENGIKVIGLDKKKNNFARASRGGGALGIFLGGTPNWHPLLKKNSPKIDTPF